MSASVWTKDLYPQYSIGDYTYGKPVVLDYKHKGTTLTIGKFCSIADGVLILLAGEHFLDRISAYPFERFMPDEGHKGLNTHRSKGDVCIGNDVWIGIGAIILSGVIIGDGASIGAGAVVSHDISPYDIVAGNPARHVRIRYNYCDVVRLMRIAWWDWPIDKIRRNKHLITGTDIGALERCE